MSFADISITTHIIWLILPLFLISAGNSFAVDNARLVFVANIDGNWDIFSANEDGTNLLRLTNTPYDEKDPAWSSNRKKIVYAASDGQLNIMDIDTKESQPLAIEPQAASKLSPSFSPDGKSIVFAQFKPGGKDDTDLMIYNLEAKSSRTLINQYAAQFWPAWSPDGNSIVYINAHCSADCGRLIQELWIADPNGGSARQLLLTNSFCQQPAWSPDGKWIAFSSDKSGNFDIWVLSLEDWKLEQITTDESLEVSPAWSPDGNKLAFISTRSGKMEIWLTDFKTGDLRRLMPFGDKDIECKDVAW